MTKVKGIFGVCSHNWGMRVSRLLIVLSALSLPFSSAFADVWKWTDADGVTRFVDSQKPIFTWQEDGKVYFSDTPDHQDAVAVELVWHSSGRLEDFVNSEPEVLRDEHGEYVIVPETAMEKSAREAAKANYCKRAKEIHDSYVNAPRLYRTNDDGEREYLNDREAKKMIRDIKQKRDKLCR